MKSITARSKRAAAALALVGAATIASIGTHGTHAGPRIRFGNSPSISAVVDQNLTLHVTGGGFGAGDNVQIFGINNDTQKLDIYTVIQASDVSYANWPIVTLGGAFSTDIADVRAACHPQYLTVEARDVTTRAMSNQVQVTMGYLC